jgi:rhodanese-related sulfurtransferase/rubrerythrin
MDDRLFRPVDACGAEETRERLARKRAGEVVLLDVRQPAEYENAHLPGATLVPLPELETRLGELDSGKPVVVYCHTGPRSVAAARFLAGRGFADVVWLRGGMEAWHGEVASGPLEWGFDLVPAEADPATAARVALALETGLRELYEALRDEAGDPRAKALLGRLADLERGHEAKVRGVLEKLGLEAKPAGDPGVLEGGFRAEDLLESARRFLAHVPGILGLAMTVECQALDLYLRYAQRSPDAATRVLWEDLAEDERGHLGRLGAFLQEHVTGSR